MSKNYIKLNIKNQNSPESKTFRIEVIDKELLSLTGGIVQGMSGTPIIQDNKIIGAATTHNFRIVVAGDINAR